MHKFKFDDYDTFVFDLDGTLLSYGDDMNLQHKILVAQLKARGKKVILATGRSGNFSSGIYRRLQLDEPFVSQDGAMIRLPKEDKILYFISLDNKKVKILLNLAHRLNLETLIRTATDQYHFENGNGHFRTLIELRENDNDIFKNHHLEMEELLSFCDRKIEVSKILFGLHGADQKKRKRLLNVLENELKFNYYRFEEEDTIEINSPDTSKGHALKILESLGYLRLKRTIAFGNSINDISMGDFVKTFVAMQNADDLTKSKAHFITDYNNLEAGIDRFITRNFK